MAPSFVSVLFAVALLLRSSHSRTLFPYEQQQLTREYVASLPEEDALLFAFEDQIVEAEAVNNTDKRCRYDPLDKKWPSTKALNKLKKQLSSEGALIVPEPQASACYGTSKNDAQCQAMTQTWTNSYNHIDDPIEVLSPLYQGLTCQPPSMYDSKNCTLGGSPSYVIAAKTVSDIQSVVNFCRNDFLRLVVKNTGHDFSGKSTGHGAFSIWTHGLKDIQYFDNYMDESGYKGSAIKAGAGVQAFELYKFADQKGVVAVAGEGQVCERRLSSEAILMRDRLLAYLGDTFKEVGTHHSARYTAWQRTTSLALRSSHRWETLSLPTQPAIKICSGL